MQLIPNILQQIAQSYKLGDINSESVILGGGYMHRLWQITTTQGKFIIKQLMVNKPQDYQKILSGEKIAGVMAEHQIPVNPALSGPDGIITKIGEQLFLVFKWIEGVVLPLEPAPAQCAKQIGQLLAKIHLLNLPKPKNINLDIYTFSKAEWETLLAQGKTNNVQWLDLIESNLSDIFRWYRCYQQAATKMPLQLVISHRDLYQPNVVWHADTPVIIDWENAGVIDQRVELLGVALNWSGQALGSSISEIFKTVIAAYQNVTQLPTNIDEDVFYAGLGSWLNWLKFNMQRSLLKNEWQQLANQEVINTLLALQNLQQNSLKILSWLK